MRLDREEIAQIAAALAPELAVLLAARLPAAQPADKPEWLSVGEAADYFGVKGHVIREAVASAELRAYRPGKQWRIRRADLEAWAADRARAAAGNGSE